MCYRNFQIFSFLLTAYASVALLGQAPRLRRLPPFWKQVDHMHLGSDDTTEQLEAYVHSISEGGPESEEEYVIATYNVPGLGTSFIVSDIKQHPYSGHFYVVGFDPSASGAGNLQILHITPDLQLTPIDHQAPMMLNTDPLALALSYDGQYLYIQTSGGLEVFKLTPNQMPAAHQQVAPIDIGNSGTHNLITTPFANHNFLISLDHTNQRIITYPIQLDGRLGNPETFNYAEQTDPRTARPINRFFSKTLGSDIAINEISQQHDGQQVYEMKVTAYGTNYATVDTFHINPHTGQLTLRETHREPMHSFLAKERVKTGWISSKDSFSDNQYNLPARWKARIGQEIVRALQQKEQREPYPTLGKDVEETIAEFATGVRPRRQPQQQ